MISDRLPRTAAESREPAAIANMERRAWWIRALASSDAVAGGGVLLLALVFGLLEPDKFATLGNLRNLALDASLFLILAAGQTFVVITAGIDLSVGAVLVLSGVLAVKSMTAVGDGPAAIALGLLAALGGGLLVGALNGWLVAKAKLSAIIVTLGTFSIAFGASQILTDGGDLRGVPIPLTKAMTFAPVAGLPMLFLIAAITCVLAGLVLVFTVFGRHTYAVGSSPEAARRAGIDLDRQLLKVYAFSGLLSGLAGFLFVARFTTTSLASNGAFTLQVLTAVALGGASFFGGRGTVLGSVFGVFIPVLLHNGLVIEGIQPFWQQVVVGVILIGALFLDRLRRADLMAPRPRPFPWFPFKKTRRAT